MRRRQKRIAREVAKLAMKTARGMPSDIEFRVKENSNSMMVGDASLLVTAHDEKGERVGFIELEGFKRHKRDCKDEINTLKKKYTPMHPIPVWLVYTVYLDEKQRGKGIGSAMYKKAMEHLMKKGSFFFLPWECMARGGTSADAEKIWNSLKTKYPSQGKVTFIS